MFENWLKLSLIMGVPLGLVALSSGNVLFMVVAICLVGTMFGTAKGFAQATHDRNNRR